MTVAFALLAPQLLPNNPRSLASEPTPLLTNAAQVIQRSPLSNTYPIRITATVTFYDPSWPILFIQDDTGALYVPVPKVSPWPLATSNQVTLEGAIGPDNRIQTTSIVLNETQGPWPPPRPVTTEELLSGRFDMLYVRLTGRFDTLRSSPGHHVLQMTGTDQRSFEATLPSALIPRSLLRSWLGAELELRGVCGSVVDSRGENAGFALWVPGRDHVKVLQPASVSPLLGHRLAISDARRGAPESSALERQLVAGTVTWQENASELYLQDASGGLNAHPIDAPPLPPGTRVEVMGVPAGDSYAYRLENAIVRVLGSGDPPEPIGLSPDRILRGDYWCMLASIEGYVLDVHQENGEIQWNLRHGDHVFGASIAQPAAGDLLEILRPGALVQTTGICLPTRDHLRVPRSFEIAARSRDDVLLLASPGWVRLRSALPFAGGAIVLAALASAWALSLRYQVRRQTRELREQLAHTTALEDRLRQAQKMEAIGQLAGGVAHDFNNILTVVKGQLSFLSEETLGRPSAEDSLREADAAVDRAVALTRQLLAFSRRQVLQVRQLDLSEALNQVAGLLRRLLGEQIELRFEFGSGVPLVEADRGMIEQVIINLTVNARDSMPKGGPIILRTEGVTVSPEEAEADPEAQPGHFACLSVIDQGCGMDAATLARLFEPFFTTKDVGKGTGLGLATVYGIVKQHHGWIRVASTQGKGSTFHVFLPASTRAAPATPAPATPLPSPGGTETILVVEDDPSVRSLAVRSLAQHGYRVLEAANGPAALAIWEPHRKEIRLLLTDMVMPQGISGVDLAAHCQAQEPALRVIYSSGYSQAAVLGTVHLVEGVNFLPKPYELPRLLKTVRDALDRAPASGS